MKNTIYKIGVLLSVLAVTFSCTSPEAETNYTPANYEYPNPVTLEAGSTTNSSIEFTYSTAGNGTGYYVVVESGGNAPTNEDVFNRSADGLVDSGSFDLTGNSVTLSITDLCDGTSYDVYAVQFTSDRFLSPTPASLNVSTEANASLGGTWDVVTNGDLSGNFGGSVVDYTSVVTITDNGDGTITFDDTTGGIYPDPNYYGGFGSPPVPHTFEVICNNFGDTFASPFANCCGDSISFQATINADGTMSVHWESAFGEVMDAVYTKQ